MPRRKTDKGYYMVKSESNDYNFGVFPKTAYGKDQAESYIKKLEENKLNGGESYYIFEK